ncbi:hypothetical protein RvY_07528 [Ramazzottius varieornatus]|uniref:Complex 1 LYR protein domain-containing protein n=1 Tax=Ramazzottius varieornatus TaxID=947166 RepID=A0A1D1VAX7_RAMVA|nr:hypothetical protein RvY_07528 [Ramazzottius varieornatus]
MSGKLRSRVINLYKQLHYMGKEYPKGADFFHTRLKKAFLKNKDVEDPKAIEKLIARGEYVIKEIEALYMLRKYRSLKKSYYPDEKPAQTS